MLIQRPATMFDARTGFRFTPGWSGRFWFSGDGDFVLVRANGLGFISPDYAEQKPGGTRRVALIGDSMFTGLQVDADARVRSLVEGALAIERPSQVLNFSLPGTGPVTSLNVYREFARRFQPDAVVVGAYTDNDFVDDAEITWRDPEGAVVKEPFARSPGDFGKYLKANSCIAMATWAFGPGHVQKERRNGNAPTAATAETPSFELAGVSERVFHKALAVWDELLSEIAADASPTIVVLFPDHAAFTDNHGWDYARPTTKLLHQRLADHFREHGARVITGGDILREHTGRYGATPFSGWKSYLSREAHQTLAELLVRDLRGILPTAAR